MDLPRLISTVRRIEGEAWRLPASEMAPRRDSSLGSPQRAAFRRLARSPILSVMAWETLRLREPGICAAAEQRALVRDKPAQRPGRDEYADS